jgi:hypothetical protein
MEKDTFKECVKYYKINVHAAFFGEFGGNSSLKRINAAKLVDFEV